MKKWMAWFNWGITTSFVLFQFFIQATGGVMARRWSVDFDINQAQVGNLSAAFFYAYVLLQIPVGIAFDRLGVRKVIIIAALTLTLGCFLMAVAPSYELALVARVLMGVGSAFGFVGMLTVTASWFSANQFAVLVGVAETIAMAGVALGEVGMASLIQHQGWRFTMHVAGMLAALITLLAIGFVRDKPVFNVSSNQASPKLKESIVYALTSRQVWLAGFFGFTMMAGVNVFASLWGVPYLRSTYAWLSLHDAASLVSMVFLGVALGGPFIAWLSNRLKKRKSVMLSFGVLSLLLSLSFFSAPNNLALLYALLLFWGITSSSYLLCFAITKETVAPQYRATSLSAMNMLLMASAPLLQPIVGHLLQAGFSAQLAMMCLPILLFLALLLFTFIEEPKA